MIFTGISRKITVAIQAIVRGALGTKISLIIDSYMKKPQSTPGLELLGLILKEYATHHETDIIYQILICLGCPCTTETLNRS